VLQPSAMTARRNRYPWIVAAFAVVALTPTVGSAGAHPAKPCRPIYNLAFLDGSRYEGADIVRVRAHGVRCRTARKVAYGATKRGMSLGATTLHYRVRVAGFRWKVNRNLFGDVDRYKAYRLPLGRVWRTVSWRLR
jgi:hypothetical protein